MSTAGVVLIGIGAVLPVIAARGVITLPDALSRQHAATKAGTLALSLVLLVGVVDGAGRREGLAPCLDPRLPFGHAAGGLAPAGTRRGPRGRT